MPREHCHRMIYRRIEAVNSLTFDLLETLTGRAREEAEVRGLLFFMPEKRFSTAEQYVHLTQSGGFALSFLEPAVGLGKPFVLPEVFHPVLQLPTPVERRNALSKLNFDSARTKTNLFEGDPTRLREYCLERLRRDQERVHELLAVEHDGDVAHPLVSLEGSVAEMTLILFLEHTRHHVGEVAEVLKAAARFDLVPFPFGEFNRTLTPVEGAMS